MNCKRRQAKISSFNDPFNPTAQTQLCVPRAVNEIPQELGLQNQQCHQSQAVTVTMC